MFILAEVDVYDVFYYNQYFFLLCACLKNMGGFMKWGVRYKTAKKGLKSDFQVVGSVLCENSRKNESKNMDLAHL